MKGRREERHITKKICHTIQERVTLGMELFSIFRTVTTVSTDVTPKVIRAGACSRGRRNATHEMETINEHGPYT